MIEAIKDKWVAALRSGEYKQGQNKLVNADGSFCCLGVLCELAHKEGIVNNKEVIVDEETPLNPGTYYDKAWAYLPLSVQDWAGMRSSAGSFFEETNPRERHLSHINDSGASFEDIANTIEKHWENL